MIKSTAIGNIFIVVIALVVGGKSTCAQSPDIKYKFSFLKFSNPKKVKKLHFLDEISVYINPTKDSQHANFSGFLYSMNDSLLNIRFQSKRTEENYYEKDNPDGSVSGFIRKSETREINYYGNDSVVGINLKNIDYLTCDKSDNFTDNGLNTCLLCLSFISTFAVAPAVSIDYAHGGFNAHRYFNIMVPSLSFFTCDLTLYLIMNRERKYKVKIGLK
ncbi:MAG TPA: hypothetical protein VK809_05975 [Bacteroidia bacterium]|jgi:hypothetical protein|nr:hypothetical protein [Bacteroidia bacterium]